MESSAPLLQVYAFDERYSVPHWRTVEAQADDAVLVAQQILDAHEHYRRVQIWLDNRQLADIDRAS
jgi:hypothetical protein